MRLWHKDLIQVLPRQQLLGQWRECCAIAKNIAEKGTPNHVLVNKIMDYPLAHFCTYTWLVICELRSRGYQVSDYTYNGLLYHIGLAGDRVDNYDFRRDVPFDEVFHDWHNGRYFWQCFFNLEEKYDCGGISEEEWSKLLGGVNQYMSRGINESVLLF